MLEEITYNNTAMNLLFADSLGTIPVNFNFFKGDIFEAYEKHHFNLLVHQTNCMGVMGAGIAKIIKDKYPSVYNSYKVTCKMYAPEDLLGTCETVYISDMHEPLKIVANLFGQAGYNHSKRQTNYEAFYTGLCYLKEMLEDKEKDFPPYASKISLGFPYQIGCGLAGGDFKIIYAMIKSVFGEKTHNKKACELREVYFYVLPEEYNKVMGGD